MLLTCMFTLQVSAQQTSAIIGTVLDNMGESVIGASVLVKGTSNGTITDLDGKFNLTNVPTNGTIIISYIGYLTQEIPVKGQKNFAVKLLEDNKTLDEVVVVGYGVQRKSDLTGAVASVKAADALKATPSGNVSDALQGRMAGVSVLSGSGDPSKDNTIRVRGINSITAEGGPLVVVDGFIGGSLKSLNPSDIQSIEVLKDASATAVYGSRGANGVILVTTRTPNKDKLTVSFNGFVNFKTVAKYPDTLSPYEFANLSNDYGREYNQSQNKPVKEYYNADQLAAFQNGTAGFDYARGMFNDPAMAQNYELSIAGGGEKTTFLASLRYEGNEGVIKESKNDIFTYRLKVDTKIRKWFKAGMNLYGYYNTSAGPRITQYDGLILQAMYFPNTVDPTDKNGSYNNKFPINGTATYNPMGHINETDNNNQTLSNRLQGYLDFAIIDGLTFRTQLGVNFENKLGTDAQNERSYNYQKNSQTTAYARSDWNMGWLNTNTLSYVKEFNKNHRINATGVFEQSYSNNYWHRTDASDLSFADRLGSDALGWANQFKGSSNREITTLMSGMLRANYVFMNRYMFTASIRADGSSRLAEKWDYFPSAAVAWDIKQEAFLKEVEAIDQFKLRFGYGSVGNQSVAPYRIYSQMVPKPNADGTTSYSAGRPTAPNLKWERNDQINAGIDVSLLNGRFRVSADWYNKISKDILLELAQPVHMGYPSLLQNAGEIRNTGIEFTIGADLLNSRDWRWHTDVTLSHNKGTFERIPTLDRTQQQAGKYENELFKMIEGEKLGTFWGHTYAGVWQEADVNAPFIGADGKATGKTNGTTYNVAPGNARYADTNLDGKINNDDMGIIGNGQPMFNWGWSNNVSYKDFDLSLFIVGFHGFDIYNATDQIGYNTMPAMNMDNITPKREFLDRWTKDNTDTDVPGFVYEKSPIKSFNSRFVEKGSFVKVKSITLGYTLPTPICKSMGMESLRVYASVQDPFHITKYSGLDPEAAMGSPLTQGVDWGAYPNSRNFLVGLNFSF